MFCTCTKSRQEIPTFFPWHSSPPKSENPSYPDAPYNSPAGMSKEDLAAELKTEHGWSDTDDLSWPRMIDHVVNGRTQLERLNPPLPSTYTDWLRVCFSCNQLTKHVFDRIVNMRVPYHAKSLRSVVSTETGHNYVTYRLEDGSKLEVVHYHPYPFKDAPMSEQRDVLYKFWQDLDGVVDAIRAPGNESTDPADVESAKVRAKTLAEVLAYLMHRYYEDGTAVLRESMARWKARQEGVTDHQTPGLAEALWDPRSRHDGTPYSTANVERVRAGGRSQPTKPLPTGNRVPETAIKTARQGIEMGMFTVAQMAATYAMTPDELKEQLGLA